MAQSMIRRSARRKVTRSSSSKEVFAHGTVIRVDGNQGNTSQQTEYVDEFAVIPGGLASLIIPPSYNPHDLARIIGQSNILKQCIEAYHVNTVGTGWEVEPSVREKDVNAGERTELQTFLDNANVEQTLKAVMTNIVIDRESFGYGFMEVIRDGTGELALMRHAPALHTRLTPRHEQLVLVELEIARGRRTVQIKELRKFRRFVQRVRGEVTYFREFGDPRRLNRTTGIFESEKGYEPGEDATEIVHFRLPSNDVYGEPRWIGQLPSILGSREAEEVNLRYFKDNTVPPMMITVSGGRLTASSHSSLTRMIEQNAIGSDRQNRMMLIEAVGEGDSMGDKPSPVQLHVEKLNDVRQTDALFGNYDAANQKKVRSSFRLPGIVLGDSNDANFANAQVSAFVAESQVFGPQRDADDELLNKLIVQGPWGLRMRTCRIKGRVPSINSPESVIKALTALNVIGAVTPRAAQSVANQLFQSELTPYPMKGEEGYEDWMDKPLVLTTGAQKSHDEQASKTDDVKETEEDGDAGFKRPENGKEGEVLP